MIEDYVLYRFGYPESLLSPLRQFLRPSHDKNAKCVLDLGCGTGLVTESFLGFYPLQSQIHLMDPDPMMLQQAKDRFQSHSNIATLVCAPSEKIPFPDGTFDFVLIGSAWHWMIADQSLFEIERVLKPGGGVFIFEYQFPKALEYSELNDWIRIQFNTHWKPAVQKPRGSLREITKCWRDHSQFSQIHEGVVIQNRAHDARALTGVIASQSRYQDYEKNFKSAERIKIREALEGKLSEFLKHQLVNFRYEYEGYLFKKRL